MTNGIALALFLAILAVFLLDQQVLHWNLPVLLGRQLAAAIEYLSFWR